VLDALATDAIMGIHEFQTRMMHGSGKPVRNPRGCYCRVPRWFSLYFYLR
jgi:hypothetical protein